MISELLFTFPNTKTAITAERALLAAGLTVTVMPMPEALSNQCGIVLRLPEHELETGRAVLDAAKIEISAIYRKQGEELHPL